LYDVVVKTLKKLIQALMRGKVDDGQMNFSVGKSQVVTTDGMDITSLMVATLVEVGRWSESNYCQ